MEEGKILVFLDAHVELGFGWLPPLLTPIVRDRRTVTTPVLDIIHQHIWSYYAITKDTYARSNFAPSSPRRGDRFQVDL